jgi:phenylacetate-CoA ligase
MGFDFESLALQSFQHAAARVPAYRTILAEAGIRPEDIKTAQDFARLPLLEKKNTFQRFGVEQLCVDGELGKLGAVLTSSGHSGIFAFGLTRAEALPYAAGWIDELLDAIFQVRSRPTLLINCLPMGVKVPTVACTLAETSVRPDMVVGLMRGFAQQFAQIILVGEAAFVKHTLELGVRSGLDWRAHRVHIVLGEEPLAENARRYLEELLGIEAAKPDRALVVSSMGVAELGLNLFSEVPPVAPLVRLRRALHEDAHLRRRVLGQSKWVPPLFTYDPRRIFVEFDAEERLILTTLDPHVHVPLIRYLTGDRGAFLRLDETLRTDLEQLGLSWEELQAIPIVIIRGRGDHALAGNVAVYPEAVKEGIYHEASLAALTTANFRIASGAERARVRIQLSPGVAASAELEKRFAAAIARYVEAPLEIACQSYESFGSGMTLDYERKFAYLGP